MSTEIALLCILAAVTLLLIAAQWTRIPYPILLVVGGLGLAVIPGIPDVELDPDVVLLVILPPLLYSAAFFTPLRELRRNVRKISMLAVGLVLATMAAVAVVAHAALDFGWAEAFVLGAIVSPTDPVAATAIARRLGVPGRIVTIVEGESLVNDATALVAYKFAVAAVVTGSFSLIDASGEFVLTVIGGIAVGIAVGALIAAIRRRLDNPPVEVTIALLSGYFAYLPADAIGVSGVLAAVTVGIYMGRQTSRLTSPTTRIQGVAVFQIVAFLLNSALFVLVGLQLPTVIDGISALDTGELIRDGALVAATVILTRIVFVFPLTYLPRRVFRRVRAEAYPPWRHTLLVSWTGMRGAVSLAAALALPLTVDAGGAFPDRDLIIFCAFSVILATLLIQGLSLPPLIKWLGVDDYDEDLENEEISARLAAIEAAMGRIDELAEEEWVLEDTAERMRASYRFRQRRFTALSAEGDFDGGLDGDGIDYETRSLAYQRLVRELLEAQRSAVLDLRDRGAINDDVLRRLERELDLEDSRLEI
ncbi:MAG: monovalent cation/hydrogen antiporter [Solirubrobacterales bacterium]|jgi:CPA1 family monovalent cation:H+ antiporter|nr:monovalent cation/hydrogen antiporter [Solirubrobacterales bacterium]